MWNQDDEEESNYLENNPSFERGLWKDWVETLCRQKKVATPSPKEWELLTAKWYSGKAPLQSYNELNDIRTQEEQRNRKHQDMFNMQQEMQQQIQAKLSAQELHFVSFKSVDVLLQEEQRITQSP